MVEDFSWALEAMKQGAAVTRVEWLDNVYLLVRNPEDPKSTHGPRIELHTAQGWREPWKVFHKELLASDWRYYEGSLG